MLNPVFFLNVNVSFKRVDVKKFKIKILKTEGKFFQNYRPALTGGGGGGGVVCFSLSEQYEFDLKCNVQIMHV